MIFERSSMGSAGWSSIRNAFVVCQIKFSLKDVKRQLDPIVQSTNLAEENLQKEVSDGYKWQQTFPSQLIHNSLDLVVGGFRSNLSRIETAARSLSTSA